MMLNKKPKVRLIGKDGNAFAILGECKRALKNAGASTEQISEFMTEAMDGDYDHLLQTCMEWCDVN